MKRRLVAVTFLTSIALVVAPMMSASAASVGAAVFVGKMHLNSAICYPMLCNPGPTGFSFNAGNKFPDPHGGPSLCFGAKMGVAKSGSKGTGAWAVECDITSSGTVNAGVTGGPFCHDSTGSLSGGSITFDGLVNTQNNKNVVGITSGFWPVVVGTTFPILADFAKSNGETGAGLILLSASPDFVFKGDSCTTGQDDYRVVGIAAFITA